MSRRKLGLATLSAIGLALAMSAQVAAYGPQVPHTIIVTPSQGTFLCEHPTEVTATVLDQDGLPIKGVTVTWSFIASPSTADRFLQQTSKTNSDGVAKTMVKLACVAGDRVITATAGGVSGSATVHVDLDRPGKPQGGVLGITSGPRLSAGPPLPDTTTGGGAVGATGTPPAPTMALIVIGLAIVLGATVLLRRGISHR